MELKFKSAMAAKGYTTGRLASELGISYKCLMDKYKGRFAFTIPEVKKIAEILELTNEQISDIFFA